MLVTFDDRHAVANAGLLLLATLAQRLAIEAAGARPGDLVTARARIGLAARS